MKEQITVSPDEFASPDESALKQAQESGSATLSAYAGEVDIDHGSEPADLKSAVERFSDDPAPVEDVEESKDAAPLPSRFSRAKKVGMGVVAAAAITGTLVATSLDTRSENNRVKQENPTLNDGR